MNEFLISVIVPIYNVEQYVAQCIESILNQTYKNLEIILVDDGSTDNSGQICDKYAQLDPRIHVIHQENMKASAARNAALDICTGEYISFIDGDDTIQPNMYSRCMEFIRKKNVDVVVFNCNVTRNGVKEETTSMFPDGTVKTGEEIRDLSLLDAMGGQVCFKLYKRICYENVRFPKGRIYSDLAISHLTYEKISRVGFLEEGLYNYSIRSSGTSLQPKPYKNYHIFLGYKEKYEYAKEKSLPLESHCLANAAIKAVAVHNDYLRHKWDSVDDYLADTTAFLKAHKKEVLSNKFITGMRKVSLRLFYLNSRLYYGLYKFVIK